jgi:GNAT superfamily N-acetyltransferase
VWYLFAVGGHDELRFAAEPAGAPVSLVLQRAFFAELASRYPGWEPSLSAAAPPEEMAPPAGAWVVAYLGGSPVGCGGVKRVDDETAEIRRVFLDVSVRGRRLGRPLLSELERRALELGYTRVRLTTGDAQPEALHLFRSAGFVPVEPFPAGVFTRHWLGKPLVRAPGGGGR